MSTYAFCFVSCQVAVEKVVEVPQYQQQVVFKDVEVPQVQYRQIPVMVDVDEPSGGEPDVQVGSCTHCVVQVGGTLWWSGHDFRCHATKRKKTKRKRDIRR